MTGNRSFIMEVRFPPPLWRANLKARWTIIILAESIGSARVFIAPARVGNFRAANWNF